MTLDEIQSDEALRRREFPVAAHQVFLAHAGDCPLPQRVASAVADYAQRAAAADQEAAALPALVRETRELAARLVGCQPGEIALVGPTTQALNLVARGLPCRRGDNVLIYFDDYPSNVYPWLAMADRGIEVRFLNTRQLGLIRPMDVLGQVDEQTRLVALASCHFIAGHRIDLDTIGRGLRERGILFCVDGIQTLGAFPTPVRHLDMLAADAHKWLLGPCAAGVFYVRSEVQDRLTPTVLGWNNVRCPDYVAQEELEFRRDARRYEPGSQNLLGLAGLRAALQLILEIGVDAIAADLLRKREYLVEHLRGRGWNLLFADAPPNQAGGILSCWRDGTDLPALHGRLLASGIVTSLRADRSGRKYIRLSPHFYNTTAELDRFLDALDRP